MTCRGRTRHCNCGWTDCALSCPNGSICPQQCVRILRSLFIMHDKRFPASYVLSTQWERTRVREWYEISLASRLFSLSVKHNALGRFTPVPPSVECVEAIFGTEKTRVPTECCLNIHISLGHWVLCAKISTSSSPIWLMRYRRWLRSARKLDCSRTREMALRCRQTCLNLDFFYLRSTLDFVEIKARNQIVRPHNVSSRQKTNSLQGCRGRFHG